MNITFKQHILTTIFLFFPLIITAQETGDSLFVFNNQVVDSSSMDSLISVDSALTKKPKTAIADKIPYKADQISISPSKNKIYLSGNAQIIYEELTLTAEKITIDKENNKLYASGVLDSIDADGNEVFKGNPVFTEKGQEPMKGKFIEYDFNTKRGKINVGLTNMEPGYYRGSDIYKIADSTMLIEDGYFTSCDLEENPHFYFRSDRMRLKLKDKMVAKPIYFYIADIPLAVVPFGIFPSKGGRRSGIIIPSYGESKYGGRFLEGLGYYWAPNDYMDATLESNYFERRGWNFRGNTHYAVRYLLNGQLSGSWDPKDRVTGERRDRWNFSYSHRQTIDPTFSIQGSGRFSSDKSYVRETSANVDERLKQNITSSLSLNKSWKGTKNSMSASFTHNQNLQTDETEWTLPNISFRRGQSAIYETITGESSGSNKAWYENVYFNYNSNGLRRGSHKIAITKIDSTINDTSFVDKVTMGLKHSLSFNAPQKVLKYLTLNPSFSYDEIWVDEITKGRLNEDATGVDEYKEKTFGIRRTFSSSISANTKLYGMFEPNIGNLQFIRHTISPSVSFSYTPDFSDPSYGYFDRVVGDSVDVEIDKFKNSPFGGTGRRESKNMNFSVGNLFQSKFIDEEGKEEKVDFFSVNFSAGHNFTSDSLNWSDLRSNYKTSVLGKSITFTTTHSLYKIRENGRKINRLFYQDGNLPRLTNFNTSFGFTINNETFAVKKEDSNQSRKDRKIALKDKKEEEQVAVIDSSDLDDAFSSSVAKERERTKNINIPWSTNYNLSYSLNRANPSNIVERIGLSTKADLTITKNWKFSWSANFDLVERDLVYQNINIYRNLHCWEMSFNWQPLRGYFLFRINIKEASLKDIEYTRKPRGTIYNGY